MPGTAPTPVNYSNVVDEVVLQRGAKGEWNNTLKTRHLWKTLNETRSIEYDAISGKYLEWKSRIGEWTGDFGYRADLATRNFARKQHRTTYTAAYSFIECPGMLSERDLQFLNSPENLSNFQERFITEMGEDGVKMVNQKLLSENTTSNTVFGVTATSTNEVPFYSLLNIFDLGSGTVQDYDPSDNTTDGNIAATDKEALPRGTYCGVSTNPVTGVSGVNGQVAGSAAPVVVNTSHTGWNADATTTWLANCLDVMDYLQTRLTRAPEPDMRPNLFLMDRADYLTLKRKLRSANSQQVVLVDTSGRSPNIGQYEDQMIPYNGMAATYDENMPAGVVYCLNTRQFKFKIWPQKYLAGMEGGAIKGDPGAPFRVSQGWDIDIGAWKVVLTMCAQGCANPYFQGAAYALA